MVDDLCLLPSFEKRSSSSIVSLLVGLTLDISSGTESLPTPSSSDDDLCQPGSGPVLHCVSEEFYHLGVESVELLRSVEVVESTAVDGFRRDREVLQIRKRVEGLGEQKSVIYRERWS